MNTPRWRTFLLWVVFLVFLFSGCSGNSGTGPVSIPAPTVAPTPTVSPSPGPAGTPTPIPAPVFPVRNITQGTQHPTIQAAIDSAQSGDEIVVSPGTYYENIDFLGKNITVRSEDPANPLVVASTVIDGGGRRDILIVEVPLGDIGVKGSVVTFRHGETREAKLAGFTIQHGSGNGTTMPLGGGIYIDNASPAIEWNVIRENSAAGGGGILVSGLSSSPWIAYNTIQGNESTTSGGGVGIINNASPVLYKNRFLNNQAKNAGGGVYVGSNARVRNITGLFWLRQNCPPAGVESDSTYIYQNNTFSGNTQWNGQANEGCHVFFNS